MECAAFVEDAAKKTRALVKSESRGCGDTENAMRRVEQKWGIGFSLVWALHYRLPKDITIGKYLRIVNAYEAHCEQQMRRFEHERAITKAKGWLGARLVRAADALAGKKT